MIDKELLLSDLKDSIVNFDEDMSNKLIKSVIENEIPVSSILGIVADALDVVGKKYENHIYYLSELMLAGDTAKSVINSVKPLIKSKDSIGKVVFGTVKGDIHDIGKTIISYFMIGSGFNVIDLGIGVDAQKFIQSVIKYKADILAMSSLLSTTRDYMRTVIKEIKKAGIRDRIKILVGGRPVTEEFAKEIGADGFAISPNDAISIAQAWMEENK